MARIGFGRIRSQPTVTDTTARPARWKVWARRLAVVFLAVALVYGFRGRLLAALGDWLDVAEPPAAADYVLVLGGDNQTRPFAAAVLYRKGLAHQVLLPRVDLSADVEDGLVQPEHEIAQRVLRPGGVPADAVVLLPGDVHNTYDEACALARFLEGRPRCSVTVLTSTYHTRRARWIFRRVVGAGHALHVAGVPPDGYTAANWWQHEDGFLAFGGEYCKFIYYWLRY